MSIRRLSGTAATMGAAAVALHRVTPDLAAVTSAGPDLQRVVDTAGAESVLLAGVAALAWGAWLWGALGLLLTALSGLPGAVGTAARVLTRCVLPAGARRTAALALGVGLVAGGPVLTGCTSGPVTQAVVVAAAQSPVTDWPAPAPPAADRPAAVPDWPSPAPGEHVVVRGECLWDIAEDDLRRRTGAIPTDGAVAAAVSAWWQANGTVIGPDPDLLLPGQVLRPPPAP